MKARQERQPAFWATNFEKGHYIEGVRPVDRRALETSWRVDDQKDVDWFDANLGVRVRQRFVTPLEIKAFGVASATRVRVTLYTELQRIREYFPPNEG